MPRLSIVIASWNGADSLERCLRSVAGQACGPDVEVIVVTNFGAGEVLSQFPFALEVPMPEGTTVPVLRAAGIYKSTGDIVALAEDHCTFGESWCEEITKAYELSYSAIGGAVENGSVTRALDWAAYFYDYSKFMLPMRPGVVDSLSGNNVSFRRQIIDEVETTFREGYFEPFTHAEIQSRGYSLYLAPSVIVYHQKTYRTGDMVARCYHLGRTYAAKRMEQASVLRRAATVLASVALPVLLTGRIVARTIRRRRLIGQLVRCFPHLLLLTSSWSLGEFAGYCAGEGQSRKEWR